MTARGRWRIFTDVDLAYGLDEVTRVADALRAGADVAIASRAHPESQMILPTRLQGYAYRRHLQSCVFSQLVRWLLPLQQRDTQAGLKGMTSNVVNRILPHLTCNGFGFDCELLTAAQYFGFAVQELPICVRYDDRASTTDPLAIGKMVQELWRVRRRWRQPALAAIDASSPAPSRQAA
jgi:dolichyl-phosphate beta-glucosyltransferase